MFVALAAVRIYLDTVLSDTVDYQGCIITSFLMALFSAWGHEKYLKEAPPEG